MNPSSFYSLFAATALTALATVSPVVAQAASSGVQEFDPQAFPGQVVDDVVVPVPSEVFSVLDKLGEPNWRQEIREADMPKTADRTKLSLMFGLVVAEGFVAVQAEDKEAVKDIGREVIDLATALGLIKAVRPHAQAILDAADKSDWISIRKEFDQTQKTVRDSMEQMKDIDLSQCVSMGGWLRGTASVTSVIGKSFSADRAELLNQPMLVEHFINSIDKMGKDKKEHHTVSDIHKGLKQIMAKMEGAVDGFTKDGVREISKICEGLLTEIQNVK
ncbi:hypothetical protein SAMN02745166_04534 [Prosthecobacter debontii]|jgi:hypothetical protein|uniref:Secreted protein n=1 Tax=Prosthecobacter debontii TaxID=48467 RepID=A0A1T4YY89_9BACT|nr:hypothetical protein [Prosthecobacter debontii]SKB06770.1 hypothetical protein SAMN02745166_04534 [Prosthecobacter debontii]